MSSIGTGYDLSASTYSPDGRVFQVEYASKAVDNSVTALGLRCVDGVVLASEKILHSKLLTPGRNRRIQSADLHVGIASAGLAPDCRQLVNRARDEASEYRESYCYPITGKVLANRLGQFMQAYTLYGSVRPFGANVIVGVVDRDGPSLWMLEPSGIYFGYNGCAAGKGKQVAKTEIEKLDFTTLTCREAVKHASRIIHIARDEAKDRDFELEITWICGDSANRHAAVPAALHAEALEHGRAALSDEMDD